MIDFDLFYLDNGLTVIFHPDNSTNIAVVNVLYRVGSRDESPDHTGFAHLFEHFMFEGSQNIPDFDRVLEKAGGSSNAFTTYDFTNYYITIPRDNIETALWLESDRMLGLDFNPHKLEIQKNVVIEEYKETVLNRPYGDDYKLLKKLAYQVHPYRWLVIGEDFKHIEQASLQQVKDFFNSYYGPNNAILSIGGNFSVDEVKRLVNKWFGDIPSRPLPVRSYPQEPPQHGLRTKTVYRDIPYDKILIAFPYFGRKEFGFYVADIITDILAEGKSSRLFRSLVKEREIFSDIDAYITGTQDPGLVIVEGVLKPGIKPQLGYEAICDQLQKLKNELISENEFEKIKNNIEAQFIYSTISLRSRVYNLAFYTMMAHPALYSLDLQRYMNVSREDILEYSRMIFSEDKANVLFYLHKQK